MFKYMIYMLSIALILTTTAGRNNAHAAAERSTITAHQRADRGGATRDKTCFGPGLIDINEFEMLIDRRLSGNVVGYGFAISEGGVPVGFGQGGFAQIPVLDNNVVFTFMTDINVASVSKPITAIAVLQLMEKLGVSPDDPISAFLPKSWELGEGFDADGITFDDLLTHQTGFEQVIAALANDMGEDLPSTNSWEGLRLIAGKGIPKTAAASACPTKNEDGSFTLGGSEAPDGDHYGVYCYKNANYALARVLIWNMALASGDLDASFDEGDPKFLPMASAEGYQEYVQDNVLAPAGVTGTCEGTGDPGTRSLMYDIEGNVPFEMLTEGADAYTNSESDLLHCGPSNWSLSALDLVQVMGELTCGELLSPESKELMKTRKMGFSRGSNSGTQPDRYWHNGLWKKDRTDVEQALWPPHPDHPANNAGASDEDCFFNGIDLVCPTEGDAANRIHTCAIEFPYDVDAALVLNSSIRHEPDVNACTVLRDAFDELF